MALIKKLDFRFSNLMHSAVVSVCGNADQMFVHVQLVNSFIRKLFGLEHIRFQKDHGSIKLKTPANAFAWQVAAAVNEKLDEELEVEIAGENLHVVRT